MYQTYVLKSAAAVQRTVSGLLIVLGCCLVSAASAQSGFERVYGGAGMEFGYSVRQSPDGGYVLLGSTESFGTGDRDIYLVRTDAEGDTLWTRTFGAIGFDSGSELELTADGGIVLCGLLAMHSVVIKMTLQGAVEWTTELPDYAVAIVQTPTGDYIATGGAWLGNANYDMFATRLTPLGDPLWTRTYGTFEGAVPLSEQARDISMTTDGGYVLYGPGGASFDLGIPSDHLLVKINEVGDTLWTKLFGGAGFEEGFSAEETDDGGLILLGNSTSFGGNMYEVIKTDADGAVEWSRTLDGEGGADEGYEIHQTPDGGYAFAGRFVDEDTEQSSVFLVKLDALGDTTWTKTFRQGQGTGLDLTADGGYAIAGFTSSIGAGLNDLYLIKTDENGLMLGEAEPEGSRVPHASVFPDPVTDRAVIAFPNPHKAAVSMLLVNAIGQTVREARCGATDRIVLERQDLPSGQYQFLIKDGKNPIAQGRLIMR